MFHLFEHDDDVCPHCVAVAETDRLAEVLREPLDQLARLFKAPVPVVFHAGDAIFDTMTLTDLLPVPILARSRRRRAITITNTMGAGLGNAVLTREPTTSLIGAAAYTLIPQQTITLHTKGPLFVTPSVAGVIVAVALEED